MCVVAQMFILIRLRVVIRFIYPGVQYLDFDTVVLECSTGGPANEPYSSDRIDRLPGGCKILSKPVRVATFNFNSIEVRGRLPSVCDLD